MVSRLKDTDFNYSHNALSITFYSCQLDEHGFLEVIQVFEEKLGVCKLLTHWNAGKEI